MPLSVGTKLGPYEILAPIGAGGMGEVYRASDPRIGREVAIKVLPGDVATDTDRLQRFEQEARAAGALNHPNILTIHDVGSVNGSPFLVSEFLKGETLRERLRGPLPIREVIDYALDIAQGLAAAHAKGIVHRDLKPSNVFITTAGHVKILDFGLAKLTQPQAMAEGAPTQTLETQPGMLMGTVGYMAPEQVRGENVDTRADIFSFGCVLYEIVTGERAFARASPIETLTAILHETPLAPSRRRRELPPGLDGVVAHCLEKDPAARFQSAHDLEFALAALTSRRAPDATRPRAASVAVLPFVNLSADSENEFFADGITEDVIAHLAKIRSLKVISRTSVMAFKKSDCSLREIAEKLGAATLLEGSVRRVSNRVRIVAQLVDAATDEHVWAETYDRDLTDIFAIQTDVALNIANALRAELSKDERTRVGRPPTYNLKAYELYLRGRNWLYRFTEDGYRHSAIDFDAAIVLDPGFALAWAGIAEAHAELCIDGFVDSSADAAISLARGAAARALEIDEELAEAHGISGLIRFVFDFDWPGAERELLRAIELSPGSAQVHGHYSWLCAALDRYDDALREVRRARELDPILIQSDVATVLLRAGRTEEALEEARGSVRDLPGAPRCHSNLGWALIFHGDKAAGITSLERAMAISPGSTQFLSQLGQAYALTGNVGQAREILEQLRDRATREFVSPYNFAYVHTGLGEADAAIDWLERAFERRSGSIYGIKGSFLFRNLRGHPRFESLLRKINLA
jgi:serine/threonine protein kinase/tetratricopeptide (TPR) repeat protein